MKSGRKFGVKKIKKDHDKSAHSTGDPPDPSSSPKSDKNLMCKIRLLDDTQSPIECKLSKPDIGKRIFTFACNAIGNLVETDYFGLRYTDKHGERQWLDLDRIAYKQLKGGKSMSVNFRLKHYPSDPLRDIKQDLTKYLIYLQIKRDLAQGRLLCPPALIGTIGALVVQAELGDAPPAEELNLSDTCVTPDVSMSMSEKITTPNIDTSLVTSEQSTTSEGTTNQADYLKNMKIFISQTPEMMNVVMKKHQYLRGVSNREAEGELLNKVSQLPTYGIDPFQVVPRHKVVIPPASSSLTTSESGDQDTVGTPSGAKNTSAQPEPVQLAKNKPYYIGISWTGLVTFIGLQRAREYKWDEIQRFGCDDKLFLVYLKENEHKSNLLTFECESKSSALALWRWTVDRKCFFTLSEGKQAKRLRPNSSLFHRHTFRFSGRSYKELDKVDVDANNEDFTRISSLRQGVGSASVGHAVSNSSRLRPPLLPSEDFRLSEVVDVTHIGPVPSVEVDQLAAVMEQTVEEDVVAVQAVASEVEDEKPTESEPECVITPTLEQPIEATAMPQQQTAVETVDALQRSEPLMDTATGSGTDLRDRVDQQVIQRVAYEQVVSTLDQTIADSHGQIKTTETTYVTTNGTTKKNGKVSSKRTKGPCIMETHIHTKSVNGDHASPCPSTSNDKPFSPQESTWPIVVATAATIFVLIGLVVMMETTSKSSHSSVIRLMRGNIIISGIDNYIYSPVRNAIIHILSILWS